MSRIIKISDNAHRKLKIHCAIKDSKMGSFVSDLIIDNINLGEEAINASAFENPDELNK